MSLITFFLSLSLIGNIVSFDSDCHLEQGKPPRPDRLNLFFQSMSTPVNLNAPDAKLISCEKAKDFSNLLVVELDLGGAGTKVITRQTDLIIFDTSKMKLNKIFQTMIRKVNNDVPASDGFEEHYKIEKSKSGDLTITFSDSQKIIKIEN